MSSELACHSAVAVGAGGTSLGRKRHGMEFDVGKKEEGGIIVFLHHC
jgi:hypothetical protein